MLSHDNSLNAFLVGVSDAVRGVTDPGEVARTACRLVATELGASVAYWTEVDWARREYAIEEIFDPHRMGGPPKQRHSLEAWGPVTEGLMAGHSFVSVDTRADERLPSSIRAAFAELGIIAIATVPVMASGTLRAKLTVAASVARQWRDEEVALVGAVAARAWVEVERARAVAALETELRDAQELQRISSSLIENDGSALYAQILAAARSLMRSEFASLQMRVGGDDLLLLAHDGFHPESAKFWDRVALDGKSPCAFAMKRGEVTMVPDVERDAEIAGSDDLREFRRSGIRAIQSTPLVSRDGRIVGMLSTHWREPHSPSERELRLLSVVARQAADLIERRLADDALRAREEEYRSLFESVDEGVARLELLFDADGAPIDFRWLDYNPAFSRHTGLGDVRGKRGREVFPDLDTQSLDVYARVAKSGRGERFERYAPDVGRWFSIFASPVPDNPAQVVVLFANETERKRAEEALRRSEAHSAYLVRLGDALRPLGDAAAVKRAAVQVLGEQLGVNGAFYGEFDGDDLVVEEVYEHDVPPMPLGRYVNTPRAGWMRDAFNAGRNVIIQDMRRDVRLDPGHRERNLSLNVVAAVSVPMVKDGRVASSLTVFTKEPRAWTAKEIALIEETAERTWDAVERARTAAALRESEQVARSLLAAATAAHAEAEAANRAKDEFLATLSHELRTPLSAILLWARSLSAGAVKPSQLRQAVDAIVQSADSQFRLIEDLLDLSRLAAGRIELNRSSVDAAKLIGGAVATIEPMAGAKNIRVVTEIDAAMGRAWLDERRIKQVLWNLLSNAVKFTPEGGTVRVTAQAKDGVLSVEVVDDGEGIDGEFLPHVFEKFRQADMAHTRRYSGLGIGLTIAQRLTALHDGELLAESEGLGRGATFRLKIPWIVAGDAASEAGAPAPLPLLDGLRVLLVEDDLETRQAMAAVLEGVGGCVTSFANATHALTAIDAGLEVDTIVSDLGLPRVSGLDLIAQIGDRYARRGLRIPPSCAVSAHARDEDRRAAIDAGYDLYLAKPITPARLVEAVADLSDIARGGAQSAL